MTEIEGGSVRVDVTSESMYRLPELHHGDTLRPEDVDAAFREIGRAPPG